VLAPGAGQLLAPAPGSHALARQSARSSTVAITATLADIAQRIPNEADRLELLRAANALDETILAIPHDDPRGKWAQAEDIPVSTDALHRERVVGAMGLGTRAGAQATDWTDVREAMRMHSMIATFVDRGEDIPIGREAIQASVARAALEPRCDGREVDVEGIISAASRKYNAPMLMPRGWVSRADVPALAPPAQAALAPAPATPSPDASPAPTPMF